MREEGYYWVKYTHEWIVSQWDGESWWLGDMTLWDKEFDEIDERRITREVELSAEFTLKGSDLVAKRDENGGLGDKLFGLI